MSRPTPPALAGAPLLVAHRCGAGLAPENTLLAMLRSRDDWAADMIELDVHLSADGHVVCIHDPTVDRTTDGTGAVAAMTLEQLRALDAGYRFTPDGGRTFPFRGQGLRIPTLDEVLEALPDMRFTVEVKAAAAQRPMFEVVRRHGAQDRVVVAGIHDVVRTHFAEWQGAVSASMEQVRAFFLRHRLHLAGRRAPAVDAFQVPETWGRFRIVTPRFIRDAHAHGIAVQVWTVNDPADMERLLRWGVDGIQSDFPDRLSDVMTRLFGRPPAPARRRSAAAPNAGTSLE
ncbi:MAG: glycerophosphodiester phosphodiesterase [Gemmatimonadetes bacterium]|nr:glycerophosphodiester phosphodiesterase [Gemmatimonadota bacterium]